MDTQGIHPKVAGAFGGASFGGALAIIVLAILSAVFPKYTITSDLAGAITTICCGIVAAIGGWIVPSPSQTAPDAGQKEVQP